jgi:hypothetical protein
MENENSFTLLPLTNQELRVLMRTLSTAGDSAQTEIADAEILGTTLDRVRRWAERQSADNAPSMAFIGLRLTHQELFVLMRKLVSIRQSDRMEVTVKSTLGEVIGRIDRWAQRQGAWWDDGHKIITSFEQQID